jgi:hypothetical protein
MSRSLLPLGGAPRIERLSRTRKLRGERVSVAAKDLPGVGVTHEPSDGMDAHACGKKVRPVGVAQVVEARVRLSKAALGERATVGASGCALRGNRPAVFPGEDEAAVFGPPGREAVLSQPRRVCGREGNAKSRRSRSSRADPRRTMRRRSGSRWRARTPLRVQPATALRRIHKRGYRPAGARRRRTRLPDRRAPRPHALERAHARRCRLGRRPRASRRGTLASLVGPRQSSGRGGGTAPAAY